MRYYRKAKASPERKAMQKSYELGRKSADPLWIIICFYSAFVGFFAGYIFLNS